MEISDIYQKDATPKNVAGQGPRSLPWGWYNFLHCPQLAVHQRLVVHWGICGARSKHRYIWRESSSNQITKKVKTQCFVEKMNQPTWKEEMPWKHSCFFLPRAHSNIPQNSITFDCATWPMDIFLFGHKIGANKNRCWGTGTLRREKQKKTHPNLLLSLLVPDPKAEPWFVIDAGLKAWPNCPVKAAAQGPQPPEVCRNRQLSERGTGCEWVNSNKTLQHPKRIFSQLQNGSQFFCDTGSSHHASWKKGDSLVTR